MNSFILWRFVCRFSSIRYCTSLNCN